MAGGQGRGDGLNEVPRRISVHGPSGSGKTRFARALGDRVGLTVHHLDRVFLSDDWTVRPASAAMDDLGKILRQPGWIVEGVNPESYVRRMAVADLVIVLHASRFVRLARLVRRVLANRGRRAPDMPQGKPEALVASFLIDAMRGRHERAIESAVAQSGAAGRTIHLRGASEVAMYLATAG